MKLNPFKRSGEIKKSKNDKKSSELEVVKSEKMDNKEEEIKFAPGTGADNILKGFYISEKSSLAQTGSNQYVFKVYEKANKSEIKKAVSNVYKVKVKEVRILNMPRKRRDIGRHPGFKSGFKKAIVRLEEGNVIKQAQA